MTQEVFGTFDDRRTMFRVVYHHDMHGRPVLVSETPSWRIHTAPALYPPWGSYPDLPVDEAVNK